MKYATIDEKQTKKITLPMVADAGNSTISTSKPKQNTSNSHSLVLNTKTLNTPKEEVINPTKPTVECVNEFENYRFLIKQGRIFEASPDYVSFKRIYQGRWGAISFIIHKLEKLLEECEIQVAIADGNKILLYSLDESKTISKDMLISCLINPQQYNFKPKQKKGREQYMFLIARCWKMYKAKREYKKLKMHSVAIKTIIKAYRSYKQKQKTRKEIQLRENDTVNAWNTLQTEFKSKWANIKYKRRIEIHINSLSYPEQTRKTMYLLNQRQNLQLPRILRLQDSNVDIIYISPFQISDDIIAYYARVLELKGISINSSRLNFIVPQCSIPLPSSVSLTKRLLFSTLTINKLKSLINGVPSYIVPGVMSLDEIKLSSILGVPIYGGAPNLTQLYSSKSGARRIFNNVDIPIPIGQYDIYDLETFESTLAFLITKNPNIPIWIFKIDDEFEGRGVAYINVDNIKLIYNAKHKESGITSALYDKIKQKLHKALPKKTEMAMPGLYQTWEMFITQFCRHGGVIEAMPSPSSKIKSPTVCFSIEPDGEINVVGSYDRFNNRNFVNAGCMFPQKSIPSMNLQSLSQAVGHSLYSKGIIGFITVDLLSFNYVINNEASDMLWGIGINCSMSNYACSIAFFNFLMNGVLDKATGTYTIAKTKENVESREFICINRLYHPGLSQMQYKSFFHMCRTEVYT